MVLVCDSGYRARYHCTVVVGIRRGEGIVRLDLRHRCAGRTIDVQDVGVQDGSAAFIVGLLI